MVVFMLLITTTCFAQSDLYRFEVFGGYSYLPAGPEDFPRLTGSHGFQTSIAANLNTWFGVVGDFGFQFGSSDIQQPPFFQGTVKTRVYEYMVGPRFTVRTPRANVFAHALFGGASGRTDFGSFSDAELAIGGGAGVDININKRVAIRAIQFDYLGSFADMLENNVRAATGIVFRF